MAFFDWTRWLRTRTNFKKKPIRRSVKPRIELLEDRVVPTVELEPNGTLATATGLPRQYDALVGDLSSSADEDLFSIGIAPGVTVRVIPSSTNPINSDEQPWFTPGVQVLNETGSVIAESRDGTWLYVTAPIGGTYYVRVTAQSDFGEYTGAYSIALNADAFAGLTETESNDTFLTANSVVGTTLFRGVLPTSSDIDTYSFSGTAGEVVTFKFANTLAGNPALRLFSPTNSLLATDLTGAGISAALTATGTYKFNVRSDNSAGPVTGFYVGQILLESSGTAETTSNDSFANAATLDLSSGSATAVGTLSSMSDLGVYAVDFTAMNFYQFYLDSPSGSMSTQNRVLSLYDEYGRVLEWSKVGYISTNNITFRPEKTGRHYLVVEATNETGLGGFALVGDQFGSFPTQRDIPIYYHDYSAFTDPAQIPYLMGLFEARFQPYYVDVTTTDPGATERVSWTVVTGGLPAGAAGFGGGYYGSRRPQGDSVGLLPAFTGLGSYRIAIHESGHGTGLPHTRHPENVMHYDAQTDLFPIGQTQRQAGQPFGDPAIGSPKIENHRNYLDWVLQAGRYALEVDPNDTRATAQDMDPFFAEMSGDADPRNDQVIMVGTVGALNDRDFYAFTAAADQTFIFDVDAAEFQEPLDATLLLYDSTGALLGANTGGVDRNSGITSVDPNLTYQFPADGIYYIAINGANSTTGNYRLKVTPDVAFDTRGPRVIAAWPNGSTINDSTRQLLFFFNKELDPATVNPGNIVIAGANTGTQTGSAYFDPLDNVLVWTADAPLPIDSYTAILVSGLKDLWGNELDGETTGATLIWPDISGNGIAGGDFLTTFDVTSADTTAAALTGSFYRRHSADRGEFGLFFDDELSIIDLYTQGITVRGDGADDSFDTFDDTFIPTDILYDKVDATYNPSIVYVYMRGIPDADTYRIESSFLDAAGNTVSLSATITLSNPQGGGGGGGVKPPVPESALASDAAFTIPGLTGSYVDASLEADTDEDDWRSTQTIAGTRVDPQIWFPTPGWGIRSSTGVTGGASDANWDDFSVQWDGYINAVAGTELYLSTGDGSRLYVDLDASGDFYDDPAKLLDNNYGNSQGTTITDLFITIPADGIYAIRMQYYENFGSNEAYLLWRVPGEDDFTKANHHGPTVAEVNPVHNGTLTSPPASVQITFNGDLNTATLTTSTFMLRYSPDAILYNADDVYITELDGAIAWDPYTHVATFEPDSTLANGYYMIELDGGVNGIRDLFGTVLDGEFLNSDIVGSNLLTHWRVQVSGDGTAGGDYRGLFIVTAPPGVVITESGGSTDLVEGTTTDTYTIALATQPFADVVITITGDAQAGRNPATLTFTPLNWDVPQTVTVSGIDDSVIEGLHTGTITHSAASADTIYNGISIPNVTVNITDNDFLNQNPVNSVPSAQTTAEDTAKIFNAAGSNLISISDPDAGTATVQVFLSVTNGVLTLGGTTGLSFSFSDGNGAGLGDGTSDAFMRFRGTIAAINTALNGLRYIPTLHFNGSSTLTITTNDLGNSGIGGPLTDSDPIAITVTAVNDAPANIVPAGQTTPEETTKVFSTATSNRLAVGDPDDADDATTGNQVVQVTLTAANGVLSLNGTTGLDFAFTADANGTPAGDGTSDGTMTFRGTINDVNNALNGLTFTPPLDYTGAASLTFTTNDLGNSGTGSALTDSDVIAITVSQVNDAPKNTVPGTQTTVEETALVFSAGNSNQISIADVDDADNGTTGDEPMQVTLAATGGVVSLSGITGLSFSFSDANGTGAGDGTNDATMTFRGTLAALIAALNGLTFTPALDFVGSATLNITTKDRGNFGTGGNLTDTDAVNITVTGVNDAPVNTKPGLQTTPEDVARVFSTANSNRISVADPDDADDGTTGNETIQVTLTAVNGSITLNGVSGLSFSFADANGTGAGDGTSDTTMTFRGSLTDVNTALNGMSFLPPLHYNGAGSSSLTILSNDLGNSGAGSALTDSDSVAITVTAVNDPPANTVPGTQTTVEETALVFSAGVGNAISVNDPDDADDGTTGNETVQVALSAANGTLTLFATTGLTFSFSDANGSGSGDGAADATMTFRGTLTNVNAALNGLSYLPNLDFAAADTLTITTKDLGNTGSGGNQTDSDTVTINVTQVNDAPVNTVPIAQTAAEDVALVFSATNGNRISIADPDDADNGSVGDELLQVTLAVVNGTITLNGTVGLSFSFSDGNGTGSGDGATDATMTFRGLLSAINTALNGMSFISLLHYNGPASATITTNDLGNFGTGTPLSDVDPVNINVTAVNDAPVNSMPAAQTTVEETTLVFTTGNLISVGDPDDADDGTAGNETVQVTLTAVKGTLTLDGTTGLSFSFADANGAGAGDGSADTTMTFRGLLSDVNAALDGMSFNPTLDAIGAGSIAVTTKDLGNFGAGGNLTDADTVTINITPANDPPVNTVPSGQTVAEDALLILSTGNSNRVSVADVDDADDATLGNETVQVTLTAANGTVSLNGTTGLTFSFADTNGTGAGDGTSDAVMTFRGTLNSVNTALNGMSFRSLLHANGAASVTITTNDLGNFGAGSALIDIDPVSINVTPVNDAPVNTVPATQSTAEETAKVFSAANTNAISVDDPDDADNGTLGDQPVQVTLTAANGVLTLSTVAGLSFSFSDANGTGTGDGAADGAMSFRGMLSDVNTALNGLSFLPNLHFVGTASVTIATKDLGNFGAGTNLTDSDTVNITVTAVNDAPVNTVPGGQSTVEEIPLIFSAANSNRISVSDPDDSDNAITGDEIVQVALSVSFGTLTLSTTTGLSFSFSDANGVGSGDGTADASMTFRATINNVNAALGGLRYTPTPNFAGTATLSITTKDLGNFGAGGNLTDSDPVVITVTPINDAPVNTAPISQTILEDVPLVFSTANANAVSIADPDDADNTVTGDEIVQVALTATNGAMTLSSILGLTFTFSDANGAGAGDGTNDATMRFRGPLADVNAALQGMTYTPTAHYNGSATITVASSDLGNFGTGGVLTDSDVIAVTITAVNDAPTFNLSGNPPTIVVGSGVQTITNFATGMSVGPANESTQSLVGFTLTQTGFTGTLAFLGTPAINLTTGTLTYQATATGFGTATFDVTLRDNGPGSPSPNANTSLPHSFTISVLKASSVGVTPIPASAIYGNATTLRVAVTGGPGGPPTGAVTITDTFNSTTTTLASNVSLTGGVPVGDTVTIDINVGVLDKGTHNLLVLYSGDTDFIASSRALTRIIGASGTTTAFTSTTTSAVYGATVSFAGQVTAAGGLDPVAGTVALKNGTTTLATVSLNGTDNLFDFPNIALPLTLGVGTRSITAVFTPASGNYLGSTSTGVSLAITQAFTDVSTPTSTVTNSPLGGSFFGQTVTFAVTVTSSNSPAIPTGGTVTFRRGATILGTVPLVTAAGIASASYTASIAQLPVNTATGHAITATYNSSTPSTPTTANFKASAASAAFVQYVSPAATQTALDSTLPGGSIYGQAITFTANVSVTSPGTAGIPTGTITFKDGGTPLATVALVSGKAIFKTSALAADPGHAITAVYNPTGNFATSTGALTQPVAEADTTTKLTSSVAFWAVNQSLTFSAVVTSVTGAVPVGTVTFTIDGPSGYFFSTAALTLFNGKVTSPSYTFPPDVGDYTVTAIYDPATGPQNFAANSAATATQTQTVRTGTTMTLTGLAIATGVTFTSIVTPTSSGAGTPTGFVRYYKKLTNGTKVFLGQALLNGSGVASLFVSSLAAGTHTIAAEYEGDLLFNPATKTANLQGRNNGRLV